MKKFIVLFIGVITLLFATNVKASKIELPEKTDHEKVKVYLFRGAGCSHCYDFLTYFADKYETYDDYFEIVTYESWNNSTNQNLMFAVKKIVGEEENGAVPFIVVGDDYHLLGFGDDSGEEIINAALEAYQDKKYTDIVAKAIKSNKLKPTAETISETATSEGIKPENQSTTAKTEENYSKDNNKISDGAVIAIVFSVIILGFAGLVFISRK